MEGQDGLAKIAKEIGVAFMPFEEALQSTPKFKEFMKDLGWEIDVVPPIFDQIKPGLTVLKEMVENETFDAGTVIQLTGQLKNIITTIKNISSVSLSGFPASIDIDKFKREFPQQVLDYLIVEYLRDNKKKVAAVLRTVGIITNIEEAAVDHGLEYIKKEISWEDVPKLLKDPSAIFEEAFNWGKDTFKTQNLRDSIKELGEALDFPLTEEALKHEIQDIISENIVDPADLFPKAYKLVLLDAPDVPSPVGIFFQTLPKTNTKWPGFAIIPFASGSIEKTVTISPKLKVLLELGYNISNGLGIFVRPDEIVIKTGIETGSPTDNPPSALNLKLGMEYQKNDGSPTIIIGQENKTRLEFVSLSTKLGARVASDGKHEFLLESALKGGKLVIKAGENDGFLNTILPEDGLQATFDLLLGWSALNGVYFEGSGGLEIELPLHIDLSGIEINGVKIALKPELLELPMELGANFKANLGPLVATVENIGLKSAFSFPSDNLGNLGPVNYDLGFKPPNGVGLSIDVGVVKGGGYLFFDFDKGEYAGALELTFSEIVSLKAIGVINTKMPDGSPGFSLIIIITAEFGTGLQLGFGFTLLGVGGLLGLNRTMKLDALAEGVRTGTVEGIMFPTNVVENAPRIISDLKKFFPIQQGKFLIGPMAKLGWGTPTLISISLGIIIEVPTTFAILGILKIALPTEEAALIVLQVNFIGAIEFDKERLWFFASMYDSRVLFITLEGEMGLLVGWGNEANFVSSVGGFHPAFNPPALPFPNPVRISLNILNESYAKIRVMGYFAVTSNTAQFGARAELFFGFSALKVEGHIAFDALFQFSPFYMIIQVSASLSVKVFGIGCFSIRVKLSLEGPTPWKAHGSASISLLFFDVDVDIDVTWGESKDATLPPISIMPLLVAEYKKQENWKALIPANSKLLVSLRKIDTLEELVLHPIGSLQLSQRAIPLNLVLDKMGSQKPDDANLFTLEPSGPDLSKIKTLEEKFAIAQFKNLKDAEKLSSPSFQNIEGGLELSISGEQFKTGKSVKRHIRYELITIDSNYKRNALKFFNFLGSLFVNFLRGNTVAKTDISYNNAQKLQPFAEKITIQDPRFAVANMANNKMYSGTAQFSSHAQAKDYMNAQISQNPELSGSLHVLPTHEINPAA